MRGLVKASALHESLQQAVRTAHLRNVGGIESISCSAASLSSTTGNTFPSVPLLLLLALLSDT